MSFTLRAIISNELVGNKATRFIMAVKQTATSMNNALKVLFSAPF